MSNVVAFPVKFVFKLGYITLHNQRASDVYDPAALGLAVMKDLKTNHHTMMLLADELRFVFTKEVDARLTLNAVEKQCIRNVDWNYVFEQYQLHIVALPLTIS